MMPAAFRGGEPEFIDDGSNSWLIRSLGEPEINSKVVNGRSLREIKFRYAMFPQKAAGSRPRLFVLTAIT